MQLESNQLIFIIFGCFICPSTYFMFDESDCLMILFVSLGLELSCIQCTSPVERITQNWDHSCLDGTLPAVPCEQSNNDSSKAYQNCVSALYRIGLSANGGKKS